jgi:hypothetical protein
MATPTDPHSPERLRALHAELDEAVDAYRVAVGDGMELAWRPPPKRPPPDLLPAEPPAPVVPVRERPPNLLSALAQVEERYRELRRLARRGGLPEPPEPDMRPARA